MKKWFVWLVILITLTILSVYVFIPAKIEISRVNIAEVTISAASRFISQKDNWEKWWRNEHGNSHIAGTPFSYNGTTFSLKNIGHNLAVIEIHQDGMVMQSALLLISLSKDSTAANWSCEMPAGNNPINQIQKRNKAVDLSKNMSSVLANLKNYISNPQNVYEISIFRTSFRDTSMLSTRFTSSSYPSTAETYHYFDILKKSIQKQNGRVQGYPMLNVVKLGKDSFETQVAIPTNKTLKDDGIIFYRKMVPGNFLCTIVTGGPFTLNESMKKLEFFLTDNNKTQMASPFQQLITDRVSEPDSSKWITRIYLPVVE